MRQYFSNTAFTDLLFNIVIGIAFLFIIAFLLINPISKKNDIKSKADYLIMLYWSPDSVHDIDVWVRDPEGNLLSFKNKESGFMHLDRDDLGYKNDKIVFPDGTEKIIKNNEETATLRGTMPGWYVVNIHAYRKLPKLDLMLEKMTYDILPIRVQLIKVNPYKEVLRKEFTMQHEGEEVTAFRFKLDEDGEILEYDEKYTKIVSVIFSGEDDDRRATGAF